MKSASEFRTIARDALKGKWGIAVLAGLIASLLGAAGANTPDFQVNQSANSNASIEGWMQELQGLIIGVAIFVIIIAFVISALYFILASIISPGYSKFNLDLVDRREVPELGTLFAYFSHWKNAAMVNLRRAGSIILGTLLFIIPGILAIYNYAMTSYILAEHPHMDSRAVLQRSKEMMQGNRLRLFFLELSFIGWDFLCLLTLGIGSLWVTPYKAAAIAAFYREVSGTEQSAPAAEPVYYIESDSTEL